MSSFNIKRFQELSRKRLSLYEELTSMIHESKNEFLELEFYNLILTEMYFWENRFKYMDLLKKFLEQPLAGNGEQSMISLAQFRKEVNTQFYTDLGLLPSLSNEFFIDAKSEGFYDLIKNIIISSNEIEVILKERGFLYVPDLIYFRNEMKAIYLTIQKLVEK